MVLQQPTTTKSGLKQRPEKKLVKIKTDCHRHKIVIIKMTNYFGNDIKEEKEDGGCTYSVECAGEVDGVR